MSIVRLLVLCLGFALLTPASAAECELIGKSTCTRTEGAACECPALEPVVNPNDQFEQCVSACCNPATGCTPNSIQSDICGCSCAEGIPHVIAGKVICE